MCEERAQGNGKTPVRVMRHRTRARRGGGIPPTKYRAADGGCSAREESRFSPKRETNACAVCPVPEDALRGLLRTPARASLSATRFARGICRQRGGAHENETSRAELQPDGVYVYAGNRRLSVTRAVHESTRSESEGERLQGRANRPFLVVSPEREARVREADALAGV